MPSAIANEIRREIIARHEGGETLRSIRESSGMSYETVKHLWQHWQQYGQVEPRYERAREHKIRGEQAVYEAAVAFKDAQVGWGAKLILIKLAQMGHDRLPSARTLQRWFRRAGVSRSAKVRQRNQPYVERGQQVHEVWAVDAKEHMQLSDGRWASWLLISDEASGAVLHGEVFPPALLD